MQYGRDARIESKEIPTLKEQVEKKIIHRKQQQKEKETGQTSKKHIPHFRKHSIFQIDRAFQMKL